MWKTDAHFVIGASHERAGMPAQDYAWADAQFIAIADGCSSGGKTDVGARVLAHIARSALPGTLAFGRALASAGALLGLEVADLLATLAVAWVEDDVVQIRLWGDGAILLEYADGAQEWYAVSFPENRPWYPAYALLPEAAANFADVVPELSQVQEKEGELTVAVEALSTWQPRKAFALSVAAEELQQVALFSDGIFSFAEDTREDAFARAKELASFKVTFGAFVRRRLTKQNRRWRKEGTLPQDDLAVAVLLQQKEVKGDEAL